MDSRIEILTKIAGIKIPELPTGNNIEFNNEAVEDFAKRKRKDDRVKFWVPVIISIAAFIVSILAYLKQG